MIISPKYDFVYFATMKTGSSSISSVLSELNDQELKHFNYDENDPRIDDTYDKKFYKHSSCSDLQVDKYKNYFKFAFVRNPWDRVVSWYHFYKQMPQTKVKSKLSTKNETFEEFILYKKINRWAGDNQDQYNFSSCCDFIGKFENLQEDFNDVCSKINIPQRKLPIFNKSKHIYYTDYYNEETRKIVAKRFAKDITHFDYEFGN